MWIHVPSGFSPSVPVSGAWISASSWRSLALSRFATLSAKPMLPRYWLRAWTTKPWMMRLFGRILKPSTANLGVESWISLWADTPVNPSLWQAVDAELRTRGIFGPISQESSKRSNHVGASLRTSPAICDPEDVRSLDSYNNWVTEFRRACLARKKSAIARIGTAFSYWPTPDAGVSQGTNRGGAAGRVGKVRPCLARAAPSWATLTSHPKGPGGEKRREGGPTLQTQANLWATPTSRDWKGRIRPSSRAKTNSLLGRQAPRSGIVGPTSLPSTRRLNPRFVEWLMGMPLGWTDCGASVTPSFQSWRRRQSSLLRMIFMLDSPPR